MAFRAWMLPALLMLFKPADAAQQIAHHAPAMLSRMPEPSRAGGSHAALDQRRLFDPKYIDEKMKRCNPARMSNDRAQEHAADLRRFAARKPAFSVDDGCGAAPGCTLRVDGIHLSPSSWPYSGVGWEDVWNARRGRYTDRPDGTFDLSQFRAEPEGWVLGAQGASIDPHSEPRSIDGSFVAFHQGDDRIPPHVQVYNNNTGRTYLARRDVILRDYPNIAILDSYDGRDYTEVDGDWMEISFTVTRGSIVPVDGVPRLIECNSEHTTSTPHRVVCARPVTTDVTVE